MPALLLFTFWINPGSTQIKKLKWRGWTDGPAVKNISCSSREPKFGSQHVHDKAHSCLLSPGLGYLMPSSGLYRHCTHMLHILKDTYTYSLFLFKVKAGYGSIWDCRAGTVGSTSPRQFGELQAQGEILSQKLQWGAIEENKVSSVDLKPLHACIHVWTPPPPHQSTT